MEFSKEGMQAMLAAEFSAAQDANQNIANEAAQAASLSATNGGSQEPIPNEEPPSFNTNTTEEETVSAQKLAETLALKSEQEKSDNIAAQAQSSEADYFDKHFKPLEFSSLDEVKQVVAKYDELANLNDVLKKEVETLKATPYFNDPNHKRIFDFVQKYDSTNERGFEDYIKLNSSDLERMDGKEAMKLAHVLERPDQSRASAEREFDILYKRTYEKLPDMEEVGEDVYNEEKEYLDIKKANEERSARAKLRIAKDQYGQKQVTETTTPEQKAMEIVINRGVEDQVTSWDRNLPSMTALKVNAQGVGELRIDVDEETRKVMNTMIRPIFQQKGNYTSDGKLKGNIETFVNGQLQSLVFQKAIDKVATEAWNKALSTVADKLGRQPEPLQRQADTSAAASDLDKYAEMLKNSLSNRRGI